MPKIITEDMIEQAAIKALHERHKYTVLNCKTEKPDTLSDGTGRRDKRQVVLPNVMFEACAESIRIFRQKRCILSRMSCAAHLFPAT